MEEKLLEGDGLEEFSKTSAREFLQRQMTKKNESKPDRVVVVGNPEANLPMKFPLNNVVTSKYTWWNGIPKNLFEQFRRVANIYFLIISILQITTDLSPTGKYNTIGPLSLVLFVTMVKEFWEDKKRHLADRSVNESTCHTLRQGAWVEAQWQCLRVGDVVRVDNKENVPADILILATSQVEGGCWVMTANLDGETNLKPRQSLSLTQSVTTPSELNNIGGELVCENPNEDFYKFEGRLTITGRGKVPAEVDNVIWRGSLLANTKFVIGLVVFTGMETKLVLNSKPAPAKRSNVEKTVDVAISIIFVTLIVMCSISTLLHWSWLNSKEGEGAWYLPFLATQTDLETAETWITFLILYNNLVPISLYVSLEFCKLFQSKLIEYDLCMYHPETNMPAMARTSNLNEDLGQVEYIFSDKTGTLTCNEMEFHMCSVGGKLYGGQEEDALADQFEQQLGGKLEDGLLNAAQSSSTYQVHPPNQVLSASPLQTPRNPPPIRQTTSFRRRELGMAGYNFDDREFVLDAREPGKNGELCRAFLISMAICHTVVPASGPDQTIIYQASSPDEGALASAASYMGVKFHYRSAGNQFIHVNRYGEECKYELLATNAFHSDRKRMSVVVRTPERKIMLYCKGADDVMLSLMSKEKNKRNDVVTLQNHLYAMATKGLRTLVFGQRELNEEEYAIWAEKYREATMTLANREQALRDLAADVEVEFELVGASAIEDRLQDGVPQAISKLTEAGIKVWMLTGDKLETAQNIGFSCQLLTNSMTVVKIDEDTVTATAMVMANTLTEYEDYIGRTCDDLALIVTGSSLTFVFSQSKRSSSLPFLFLQLCKMAKVVIACRVIPAQKAEIVKLIREGVTPVPLTLAIGDGANDVAMIQEAHVGVGISGNEGMQAVRSADYAFAQFRFLERLLLVHGRWNYRRVSMVILYSFYKNIANVLTLFYFVFSNGFSGTTLYETWLGAGWNVGWTVFPILLFGIFEQDIRAETALKNPLVYKHGQMQGEFNIFKMARWLCNAVVHSVVIYIFCYFAFAELPVSTQGDPYSLFMMGTIINFVTVVTVNMKISLETRYWTWLTFAGIALSVFVWIMFVIIYSRMIDVSFDFFGIASQIFSRPLFYLLVVLVPLTAIIFDLVYMYWARERTPSPLDILKELEFMELQTAKKEDRPPNLDFTVGRFHRAAREGTKRGLPGSLVMAKDRDAVLLDLLLMLKSVWSYDQAKPDEEEEQKKQNEERKKEAKRERISFVESVKMHWLTLEFPNSKLEKEFLSQYVVKTANFVRNAMVVMYLLLCIYVGYSIAIQEDLWELRLVVIVAAGVAILFTWTKYYRIYFGQTLMFVLVGAAILRTVLVSENGTIGFGTSPVIFFLIMRYRFIWSLVNVIIDAVFFNIYMGATDKFSADEFVVINFLHLLIVLFIGQVGYKLEKAYRQDFLLQKDFHEEGVRTQEILDNMLPRYISKQLELIQDEDYTHDEEEEESDLDVPKVVDRRHSEADVSENKIAPSDEPNERPLARSRTESSNTKQLLNLKNISDRVLAFVEKDVHVEEVGDGVEMAERRLERLNSPRRIAGVVKAATRVKAKQHRMRKTTRKYRASREPSVTVLFCDVVNFNDMLQTANVDRVILVLDSIYTMIDELCDKYGLHKMETVGKTYMACAGLHATREDHAIACAEMAEEILALMAKIKDKNGQSIAIRIGLHSGPVIAGVVGVKKPQFCLFGDTVNTSSRMQSTGQVNRVNISPTTYQLVKEDFECEERRPIFVKGKGLMKTYFLGPRITSVVKNRKHKLKISQQQTEANRDRITEVKRIIHRKLHPTLHEFNPLDPKNPINIRSKTLRFKDEVQENNYAEQHSAKAGKNSRVALLITCLFFFVEAFFEAFEYGYGNESQSWRDETDTSKSTERLLVFSTRFSVVVLGLGLFALTYTEHFKKYAQVWISSFFLLGMMVSVTIPLVLTERLAHRDALVCIFCMILLAQSDTLEFITNVFVNGVMLLTWVIAAFNNKTKKKELGAELTFFIVSAALINLISTYGREYYFRREFALKQQVQKRKEQSEILLYQLLPKSIAKRVRSAECGVLAEQFERVSILYSDIKGFTMYSASTRPVNVVKLLSEMFSFFDDLTEKHNVYKIQTIGDAYVIVSGLPFSGRQYSPVENADNIVRMAMDMHKVIDEDVRTVEGKRVTMRIGIHTGTIIGGVIGTRQLRYDIWGSDCLVANKLESIGIPGGVVVSEQTKWYLEGRYVLEKRRFPVKVKGVKELTQPYSIKHPAGDPTRVFPHEFTYEETEIDMTESEVMSALPSEQEEKE